MGVPVSDLSTAMSGTQSARTSECNLHCVLCCLPFPLKCVPNRFLPPPFIPELQSPFVATYIDVLDVCLRQHGPQREIWLSWVCWVVATAALLTALP
jgi:hypothetical protein